MKELVDKAVSDLKEKGNLQPMLIVDGVLGQAIVMMEFPEEVSKRTVIEEAGRAVAEILPFGVAIITECWTAKTMPQPGQHLCDMPDREEAISILYWEQGKEIDALLVPFTRVGTEIVLGETSTPDPGTKVAAPILAPFWIGVAKGATEVMHDRKHAQNN